MGKTFDYRDAAYRAFLAGNPGVSFAEYSARGTLANIAAGNPLPQLGPKLTKHADWWEAGRSSFQSYVDRFGISPASRVADYGCGTLRVGGHFIKYLDRGGYFGLEVDGGLNQVGRDLIGPELAEEKAPRLGVIFDAGDMAAATAFGADFVYSSSVCYHVHPDEAPLYFANLERLTNKPGAVLFFSSAVADQPAQTINLARPLPYFAGMLPSLEFVRFHNDGQHSAAEPEVKLGLMEFRRAGA